jgi:hypothetical protein
MQSELPNLNFGFYVKQLQCSIQPSVVSIILDHYMRRPQGEDTVVGTLLGSVDGQIVDIQTCFSVPMEQDQDNKKSKLIDKDYNEKMLKFHRKVNPKEDLIGMYLSGTEIDAYAVSLFQYYQELSLEKTNRQTTLAGAPLIMLIDPTMKNLSLSIKVSFQSRLTHTLLCRS